ncbi:MAG TPA: hypothetical protein PKI93_04910 [Alphaproteobacteria bacterium]|nr:hypothetical protein [Alphaproteobacteria bacterium]HNS45100.1 hypothetical protein [Alphaproteobacteria bacterium]
MNRIDNRNLVIRLVRITAAILCAVGLSIFFDVSDLASQMGWVEDGLNRILGAALMVVAAIDAMLVPRILEKSSGQDKV